MVTQERRKAIVSSFLYKGDQADWYSAFSNNYGKLVRVLVLVLRFVNICRKARTDHCVEKILQCEEFIFAEKCVLKYVQ